MRIFKFFVRLVLAPFVFLKNLTLYFFSHFSMSTNSESGRFLRRDGFYFFREQLDSVVLDGLSDKFNKLLSENKSIEEGQSKGRILITELCKKSEESVFSDLLKRYEEIARDYFRCTKVSIELAYFQKSKSEKDTDNIPGGNFHIDDNKKNLKFFVYLNDVDENNGPFVYAAKTHGPFSLNRIVRWFFWELTLSRRFLYTKPGREFGSAISITGKAGSVFCADTTGFHKASKVKEGNRSVFVVSFAETRFDPYSFIKGKVSI